MKPFHLRIATIDGVEFDGMACQIILRTIAGDAAVLAGHIDYCSGIGAGEARVTFEDGTVKKAACIGGMISVIDGECMVAPVTWEWQDEIDMARAELAEKRARERLERLQQANASEKEQKLAEAKLKRSLVRQNVKK